MAHIDLTKHDLLDLMMAASMSDERQEEIAVEFMEALGNYIGRLMESKIKPSDQRALELFLSQPFATPKDLEELFRKHLPDYESDLIIYTLSFKKMFLLDYYQLMCDETGKDQHVTKPIWEQICQKADADEWDEVAQMVIELEKKYISAPSNEVPIVPLLSPMLPS